MSKAVVPEQSSSRDTLVARVLAFLAGRSAEEIRRVEQELETPLDAAGPEALEALFGRLSTTGAAWTYYPPDPLAQKIERTLGDVALPPHVGLVGAERLEPFRDRPLIFLPNHLSYGDANLLTVLLGRAGFGDVASRLTVIVGPKVYSDATRRFFSLCFGTIKTPQSTARSSEDAVMPARAVAQLAKDTIAVARERQAAGDALLVFVEGSRSRTRTMQRALPAVKRYFDHEGGVLVPIGIAGSEKLVPVGEERLHTTEVDVRVGHPADVAVLEREAAGNRTLSMDAVGVAIARLLPPAYRGVYAEDQSKMAGARRVADRVFGNGGAAG